VEDQLTSAAAESPTNVDIAPLATPSASTEEGGRYIVQVASFGALDNANRLAATLREQGYEVLLDSVTSDLGVLHRIRVGPYETEIQANEAVSSLQAQDKNTQPRVMDLQPQKDVAVTQPSDPLLRWVVQVGSFSDASNADNLVALLRLESMSAYSEEITRSGSKVYRVRVGPFLQREDAIKADKLITERLSIDGVVMSAD
jgi:DedD protein